MEEDLTRKEKVILHLYKNGKTAFSKLAESIGEDKAVLGKSLQKYRKSNYIINTGEGFWELTEKGTNEVKELLIESETKEQSLIDININLADMILLRKLIEKYNGKEKLKRIIDEI